MTTIEHKRSRFSPAHPLSADIVGKRGVRDRGRLGELSTCADEPTRGPNHHGLLVTLTSGKFIPILQQLPRLINAIASLRLEPLPVFARSGPTVLRAIPRGRDLLFCSDVFRVSVPRSPPCLPSHRIARGKRCVMLRLAKAARSVVCISYICSSPRNLVPALCRDRRPPDLLSSRDRLTWRQSGVRSFSVIRFLHLCSIWDPKSCLVQSLTVQIDGISHCCQSSTTEPLTKHLTARLKSYTHHDLHVLHGVNLPRTTTDSDSVIQCIHSRRSNHIHDQTLFGQMSKLFDAASAPGVESIESLVNFHPFMFSLFCHKVAET